MSPAAFCQTNASIRENSDHTSQTISRQPTYAEGTLAIGFNNSKSITMVGTEDPFYLNPVRALSPRIVCLAIHYTVWPNCHDICIDSFCKLTQARMPQGKISNRYAITGSFTIVW